MSEGLKTTFELLSANAQRSGRAGFGCRRWIAEPLTSKTGGLAHDSRTPAAWRASSQIIRRLHLLEEADRAAVFQHRPRLDQALHDAVLSTDRRAVANGCKATLWFREYAMLPTLVHRGGSGQAQCRTGAATTAGLAERSGR